MSDPEHLKIIQQGVTVWNEWRDANKRLQPDLTRADLSGMDLANVDFRGVGLFKAKLHNADITQANLRQARLVSTEFDGADLSGAEIYGTSVWDVSLKGTIQKDLVITPPGAMLITVDDLAVAQFIYLLLNNKNIRQAIDAITSKVVLILGRFSPERKEILDLIKAELRLRGYLPVLFDFDAPSSQDLTETVSTLAHLAKFVIADLTDPSCIPHELYAIIPHNRVPIVSLINSGAKPYAMFDNFTKYPWVADPETYLDGPDVQHSILPKLIEKAERIRQSFDAQSETS